MRRTLSLLASCAVAGALVAAVGASPAAADLGCPDDMAPVPRALVNNGEKKDHNGNFTVCAKPADCEFADAECRGGPDDELFGVPLLGVDGVWYHVTDDA